MVIGDLPRPGQQLRCRGAGVRRGGPAAAAFIWIVIKLPQEWWIHIAQLDTPGLLQEQVFGIPAGTPWGDTLVATIFGQVIPSLDATPRALAIAVTLLVVINTAASEWFQRQRSVDLPSVIRQFLLTYAIDWVILAVGSTVLSFLSSGRFELQLGGFLLLLLSLLITLDDRYRPEQLARFPAGQAIARPDLPPGA